MKIVYYIINFLILAAILFLFGRKTVLSLFRGRRERINRELDEAEALERASVEQLTPAKPEDGPEPDAEPEAPDEQVRANEAELEEAEASNRRRIEQLRRFGEQECAELRRDKLERVRTFALDSFTDAVKAAFDRGGYSAREAQTDRRILDEILTRIKLTPGDMSYLKYHEVLYVTLTSAKKLPEDMVEKVDRMTREMLEAVGGRTSLWVLEDPELISGLKLRIGDTVYDGTLSEKIYRFRKSVEKRQVTESDSVDTMTELFREISAEPREEVSEYQLGRVISVSDGICWMDGLADIMYGEVVEFDCGERGMVLDIQKDRIGCVIFGRFEHIESYTRVRRVGRIASVPAGEAILGRVVDAVGNPVDGKGHIRYDEKRPIEFRAPGILDRAAVHSPLHTGLKAIDALVPIGKGQRELLIGDRQTGKTAIVLDTILSQKGKNVICVYVAIGQKETTISDFREKLERLGALDYTVIVAATASGSAAMQYIAPYSGTAIGEYFMYSGKDVLIIYDDLSKHAVAYRELSLLLGRPSGREAYPGYIFYLHSRLLERSAQLSAELGGGSMTALPLIETQAGDISSYIPTNVISITDGQIFLESELFHSGQRPAVNVGLSVSRVGSAAQTGLMKQCASNLRAKLAQYRELEEFTQFGTDVDEETRRTLNSGRHLTEALKQDCFSPREDWMQALLLYAVSEGCTDSLPLESMADFEEALISDFETVHPELAEILKTGNKMSPDTAANVLEAARATARRF